MSVRVSYGRRKIVSKENTRDNIVIHEEQNHQAKPRVQKGLKDGLYFVRWRLEKVSKNEINKGKTTAFKRCNTVSEAKRFKKTFHELNQLKTKISASNDLFERGTILQ